MFRYFDRRWATDGITTRWAAPVAGELVGHQHPRHVPQALEQSAEELLGGLGIPARLDQDVEYVAVLVDRAPQVVDFAVDLR